MRIDFKIDEVQKWTLKELQISRGKKKEKRKTKILRKNRDYFYNWKW